MPIPCDEVNILNTFRVMITLRLLLLLTNLHLKLLSTQGTGADKLLSTQSVKSNCELQTQFSQTYLYCFSFFFSECRRMFEDAVINFRIVILYL